MRLKISKIFLSIVIALFTLVGSAVAINLDSGYDKGKLPANQITVDTTNFSLNLTTADSNVQHALNTLDQLVAGGGSMTWPLSGGIALYSGSSTWSASIANGTGYLYDNGSNSYSWTTVSGSMVYPGAGIALSTGSAWTTSITDNSANWNTALQTVTADSPLSGSGTSGSHLVIAKATASANGYLWTTDYATFNGKQANLGYTPSYQWTAAADSGTPFLMGSSAQTITLNGTAAAGISTTAGSNFWTISQTKADATHNGYLWSTDWNTFNGKISANQSITWSTSGGDTSGTASGTTSITPTETVTGIQGKAITLATGFLKYTGSAWTFDATSYLSGTVANTAGGTGQNSSTWTGIADVNNGTWTVIGPATGYLHWTGSAWTFDTPSGSMTWPAGGVGIPNYTGSSAWGTSYTTTGSGTVLMLGTSPQLTTSLLDSNGATLLGVTATDSAANYITLANNTSSLNPTITAAGSGTNIGLNLTMKGTGGVVVSSAATQPFMNSSSNSLEASPSAGDWEYEGIAPYFSPVASSRGVLPSTQFIQVQGSASSLTAGSGAQQLFKGSTNGTLTVQATTTYHFRANILLSTGSTTHTTAFLFALGGGASVTSCNYIATSQSEVAVTATDTTYTTWVNTYNSTVIDVTSTAVTTVIHLDGIIMINAAGTIQPEINFSANPTGTNTLGVGSYFEIYPVGTNTVNYQGNWS